MEAVLPPLFGIAKQIQHQFLNENGKDIYFWFREGHLEKASFNIYKVEHGLYDISIDRLKNVGSSVLSDKDATVHTTF